MNSANDLMQRLAVSKKIMDKHSEIKRGNAQFPTNVNVQEFETPQASYNIPQEFLSETTKPQQNDLFILDNNGSSIFFDNGSSTLNSGIYNLGLLITNNLIYIIKLYFIY